MNEVLSNSTFLMWKTHQKKRVIIVVALGQCEWACCETHNLSLTVYALGWKMQIPCVKVNSISPLSYCFYLAIFQFKRSCIYFVISLCCYIVPFLFLQIFYKLFQGCRVRVSTHANTKTKPESTMKKNIRKKLLTQRLWKKTETNETLDVPVVVQWLKRWSRSWRQHRVAGSSPTASDFFARQLLHTCYALSEWNRYLEPFKTMNANYPVSVIK